MGVGAGGLSRGWLGDRNRDHHCQLAAIGMPWGLAGLAPR
jgi:hypothetical protein